MYGSLRNRVLEIDKTQALVTCNGNFDKTMSLSLESKTDLKWWVDTLPLAFNLINYGDPQAMMTTDAFFTMYGFVGLIQSQLKEIGLQQKLYTI